MSQSQSGMHMHVQPTVLYWIKLQRGDLLLAAQCIKPDELAQMTSSPDKRQLCHPANNTWHLCTAEQEATKQDGQQHC